MKSILILLAVATIALIVGVLTWPEPEPTTPERPLSVPAHGYHWPRTTVDPNINIRYVVTHNHEDSVTKQWLGHTEKVFGTWSAFRPVNQDIRFTKVHCEFYTSGCAVGSQPAESRTLVVEITNYGDTGWAARTTIWPSGSHIDRALVELNAFYFAPVPAVHPYMRGVYCHAVGAALGVDDNGPGPLDGTPDDTCMNDIEVFTNDRYNIPNGRDSTELGIVYNHFDPIPTPSTALPVVIDTLPAP